MARETSKFAKRQIREKVQEEGLSVAYQALIDVCRDKSAPAPARATAATTLFRGGGMFDRQDAEDEDKPDSEKPYHVLLAEAEQRLHELKKREAEALTEIDEAEGDGAAAPLGIFG